MSLVPTFVLAIDGKFYKDPVLKGDDWFLCFDDDEPPEVVVRRSGRTSAEEVKQKVQTILDALLLKWSFISNRPRFVGRCFNGDIKKAASMFVRIDSPIPVPQKHDGVFAGAQIKRQECVYYSFGKPLC